jgi:hypothetical protein
MTLKQQMTKTALVFISALAIIACQKNHSNDSGGSFATTPPQNCADLNNPACTPSQPQYYQQNAPQFINYQWEFRNGFCGCPAGYRPVFNNSWGLACAPGHWQPTYTYYSALSVDVQSLFYGPQNGQWTSIPQMTYSPATSGSVSACGAQASLVCDIRVPSSCRSGSQCIATGGGTYMGLCTTGTGSERFYPQQPATGCLVFNGWSYVNVCGHSGAYNPNLLPR